MNHMKIHRLRMLNAISGGDASIVRDCLERGVSPNGCTRLGRTPLMRAVRAAIVESGVVDVLLEFGADATKQDSFDCTALDYAHRRLANLGPGPDPVHRSRSLDEHGNLRLSPAEQAQLDQFAAEIRDTVEDDASADEFIEIYMQERRKAALRQHMPRRELKIIIAHLEEALRRPSGEADAAG